ncbi:hypothetical protein RHIZ_12840 [Rhizobium skierniewicense]|uniref:LysE family translocator n=1 Tax=Rhizobium TaxID=379 RepID=UPI001FAB3AEE|nr:MULTISPECIES: hypothetical protein [Rhizobium]MCI9866832.1 hypothetical protein [Rhizobium skierniewicense]
MSTILEFTGAILLLLLTPGPTNTLMALAGYSRGIARALPLITAECAGYLTIIIPVAVLAAPFLADHPALLLAAKICASLWVLYLSYRLWFKGVAEQNAAEVTARDVMVTTMLNPKALMIAIVIMPHGHFVDLFPWLALFTGLVLFAASGWITLGHCLSKGKVARVQPRAIQRIAAACLLVFAAVLATASLRAMA